jgi:uncharacterized protein YpmS
MITALVILLLIALAFMLITPHDPSADLKRMESERKRQIAIDTAIEQLEQTTHYHVMRWPDHIKAKDGDKLRMEVSGGNVRYFVNDVEQQ